MKMSVFMRIFMYAVLNEVCQANPNPHYSTWTYRIKIFPPKAKGWWKILTNKWVHILTLNLSLLLHSMHNSSSENSLAMCVAQTSDNVPEAFQGQDGFSDIREKPHRAEADSLHVLHLPPIKRPWALRLSRILSLSDCKLPPDFSPPRNSHFFNIHQVLPD